MVFYSNKPRIVPQLIYRFFSFSLISTSLLFSPLSYADQAGIDQRRTELDTLRAKAESTYQAQSTVCYQRFFVNACLDKAKEVRRQILQEINREQVSLNDQERLEHASQKQSDAAARQAEEERLAPLKAAERKQNLEEFNKRLKMAQEEEAKRAAGAVSRNEKKAEFERKQRERDEEQRRIASEARAQAELREANQRAYERKQEDAREHAMEIEKKKAEKQQDKDNKSQSNANQGKDKSGLSDSLPLKP